MPVQKLQIGKRVTVNIPFPLSSAPGRTPYEGSGRLLNCYAEPLGDAARAKAVWRRSPGLSRFAHTTQTGFRGQILVSSTLYAAFSGKVRSYDSAGVETVVGNLTGTAKVFWARNNKSPTPDLVVVDPDNGAFSVSAGSVISFADADLPAPNSVDEQDGYLIFTIGDGRAFATDLNAVTVNALNFGKAESKPDGLIRGLGYSGLFFFFGPETIEVWSDTGNPTGFPYSRSTVIGRGLAGRYAVAGQEDGFTKALIWVAEDNTVVRLNGFTAEKISPPDLDRLIEAVTNKNTLEASVYVSGGHSRWVLSCASWTWEFDLATQKWSERSSLLDGTGRWRATQGYYAFNKWLVGDDSSGDILYVDDTTYEENGDQQLFRIESGPVHKFPNRERVTRADFEFSVGVGIATGTDRIQTDPIVAISWSLDGGTSWGVPILRKLGAQGRANTRVTVNNLGLAGPAGIRFRLDVPDPVYVSLTDATTTVELRAN
jgi:hypothetical protein